MRPSVLLNYFEDIAMQNSSAVGVSMEYYDSNKRGFMLLSWEIRMFNWPSFNETITIITTPTAFKRFLANREYKVYNSKGELVAEANSVWIFTDTQARKPVSVPDELYPRFGIAPDSHKHFTMLDSVKPIMTGDITAPIQVLQRDIDMNNHVNNVRYVEWALESIPRVWAETYYLKSIRVNYKRELYLEDRVHMVSNFGRQETIKQTMHSVYSGETDVCNIELRWE